MNKLAYVLLFWLSGSISSFGQNSGFFPGYVITHTNDTIHGFVKYINQVPYRVLANIKFKETMNSKAKSYAPGSIAGYMAQHKVFHSLKNPNHGGNQFMQLVIDGYIRMYTSTVTSMGVPQYGSANQKSGYLLKRGESHLFDYRKSKFKDRVSEYVADHKNLSEMIKQGAYKKRDIIDIVLKYNSWKERG